MPLPLDSRLQAMAMDPSDVVTCIRRGAAADVAPVPAAAEQPLDQGVTVAVCTYKRAAGLMQFLHSLQTQTYRPQRLVVVDASPDAATEQAFRQYDAADRLADDVLYFRVQGAYQTLTCSRNFALRWADTDLVAFFDDDTILLPDCLQEMVRPHRELGGDLVGVGGFATNYCKRPPMYWRMRRALRMVPHLQPGRFPRSGIAIPWSFLQPTDQWVEGEWLMGCAMMWKTELARRIGFNEGFGGHSTGEDVDFSLRMGRHGKLLVAGKAHLLHMTDSGGRPNAYQMGYTGIRNSYDIHRRCLKNRTWRDGAWFAYTYGLDAMMRMTNMLARGDRWQRYQFLRGRMRFLIEALSGRFQLSRDVEHDQRLAN